MSSSSFSFSSSSYSSSSSTGHNGQRTTGHAYSSEQHSDPHGTTVRTTTRTNDEPVVEETRYYDASGREVPEHEGRIREGRTLGQEGATSHAQRNRVEDVSGGEGQEDRTDRVYRERMEDEYAKREGGA